MAEYLVEWTERTPHWCRVEAISEEEAMSKMVLDEIIEGSQDSDPGSMDNRTIRARLYPGQ